jgi:benzoylformate decarboxylase
VLKALRAEGVKYVFGNPGTSEIPLFEALLDAPELEYVLCLHETVAVSMADGYAHASGGVGFVNLHVAPGVGNAIGSIYGAWEGRTPLVVTAGTPDTRLRLREPLTGHDLAAMAAPVTKWSAQVEEVGELPLALNRAFKLARDPPPGPVFVSLPMNVMAAETELEPMPPSHLARRSAPGPEMIAEAVELLLGARRPLIVSGDMVARSGRWSSWSSWPSSWPPMSTARSCPPTSAFRTGIRSGAAGCRSTRAPSARGSKGAMSCF